MWLFIFWCIQILSLAGSEEFQLEVDEVSGDLIKPPDMSEERFKLLKVIRLKDAVSGALGQDDMKSEGRVKRQVMEDQSLPAVLSQGFYKQDTLLIEKFDSFSGATTIPDTSVETGSLARMGSYQDQNINTKLLFVVESGKRITPSEWTSSGWSTLRPAGPSTSFSNFIDFSDIPTAKISDVVISKHPKGVMNFVCVTVDYPLPYPRNSSDTVHPMHINNPVAIPENSKSFVLTFKLFGDGSYSVFNKIVLDTVEAKDAEFWTFDGKLFLGIAQFGNLQVDQKVQRSLIYVQRSSDIADLSLLQGIEGTDLATTKPLKVCHFLINGRSYVAFANSEVESQLEYSNQSPIYSYSYEDEKYQIYQWLPTFGAKDVSAVSIQDTYPIHSQHFIFFANSREVVNGVSNEVESTAFKYVKGRFVPFQCLLLGEAKSVVSFATVTSSTNVTTLSKYQERSAEHLVLFVHGTSQITAFQFNGKKFVNVHTISGTHEQSKLQYFDLSLDGTPEPRMLLESSNNKPKMYQFTFNDPYEVYSEENQNLKYCLQNKEDRINHRNFRDLYNEVAQAPSLSDLASGLITLRDLVFLPGTTVTVGTLEATVEAGTNTRISVEVAGLQTIDETYPESVQALTTASQNLTNQLGDLKSTAASDDLAKLDRTNTFVGPLSIQEINGTELSGVKLDVEDTFTISSLGGSGMDIADLVDNIILIAGPEAESATYIGHTLFEPVYMENAIVSGPYEINELEDRSLSSYVNLDDVKVKISGTTTFEKGATFLSAVNADFIDGHVVNATDRLMKNGDQTMGPVSFLFAKFENFHTEEYNGFNLSIMKRSLNMDDEMFLTNELKVDTLVVHANVQAKLGALDESYDFIETVDFDQIVSLGMRKSLDNIVRINHHYANVSGAVTSPNVTNSTWPDDFVNKENSLDTLSNVYQITFDNLTFVNPGRLQVADNLTSMFDSTVIQVDSEDKLDVVLVANHGGMLINASKQFENIHLEVDTVVPELLGLDVSSLNDIVTAGEVYFNEPITIDSAVLSEEVIIENLYSDTIDTNCGTGCITNDLSLYVNSAYRRNTTDLSTAVDISFERAVFEQDVDIEVLNSLRPKDEFVTLVGSAPRKMNNITFINYVDFAKDLGQIEGGQVKTCKRNLNHKILCKLDDLGNCCHPDTDLMSCKCKEEFGECVIKDVAVDDYDVCETIVMNDLRYIDANSLKLDGQTEIHKSVNFYGGFSTDILEVNGVCTINDVDCLNIASTVYPETYTGFCNTIHGSPVSTGDIEIESNLTVHCDIDTVDINKVYIDTWFINSTSQAVNGTVMFLNEFQVNQFTSNDVSIGSTPASYLTDRSTHALNTDGNQIVTGKLKFGNMITEDVTADTFDGVDMSDFLNNLWTHDNQTILGNLTITGDAIFRDSLGSSAETSFNKVDIVALENNTIKIDDGSPIALNDVVFDKLVSLNDSDGILVSDTFLGYSFPDDLVRQTDEVSFIIDGAKHFQDSISTSFLNLDAVQWKNLINSKSVDVDKLYEFLEQPGLTNVKVHGNLSLESEPTVSTINDISVDELDSGLWFSTRNVSLDFDLQLSDVNIDGVFTMDPANGVINTLDLLHWKANYLSLESDQDVDANFTFNGGLTLEAPLSTLELNSISGGVEFAIVTSNRTFKIKELSQVALYKDQPLVDTQITPKLIFESIDVAGDLVIESNTVNGIDLDQEALTYSLTDQKTFVNPTTLDGNVSLSELNLAGYIIFPTDIMRNEFHAGLYLVSNTSLKIIPSTMYTAGVNKTAGEMAYITGPKIFSASVEFADLTVDGTVQDVDIGDCDNPNLLLTTPCTGTTSQSILGNIEFGTEADKSQVSVNNLVVVSSTVNSVDLDDLNNDAVLKSSTDEIIVTGFKSFQDGFDIDNATFVGEVFGVQVNGLVDKTLRTANMDYQSGVTTPDLVPLLDVIKKEASEVPAELLFVAFQDWTNGTSEGKMVSLVDPRDSSMMKLAGIGVKDQVASLYIYGLFSNLYTTASVMSPLYTSTLTLPYGLDFTDIVSIPVSDTQRVLVLSNAYSVSGSSNQFTLSADPGAVSPPSNLVAVMVEGSDALTHRELQESTTSYIYDLEHITIGSKDCFIMCQGSEGGSIHCLEGEVFVFNQALPVDCYKVAATGCEDCTGELQTNKNFIFAVSSLNPTSIAVLEVTGTTINHIDTVNTPQDVLVDVVKYKDAGKDMVFVSMLSSGSSTLVVGQYDPNVAGGKFEMLQEFDDLTNPRDAKFLLTESRVSLFVLSGVQAAGQISNYVYRGVLNFVDESLEKLNVQGVNSIQPTFDYSSKDAYVLTTGKVDANAAMPSTAVFRYAYKQGDVSTYRESFKDEGILPPEYITESCQTLVGSYLERLYDNSVYNVQMIGELMLRLMPRNYIEYKPSDFVPSIETTLTSPSFQSQLDRSPPSGVVNLYKFRSDERERDFTDTSYLGSLLIYNESPEDLLYLYSRMKTNISTYNYVEFQTQCKDGTPIQQSILPGADYSPRTQPDLDGETRHQCSLTHGFTNSFLTQLNALDNKGTAGAVVIYSGTSASSTKLACGYIQNPSQAKLQFYQDHDVDAIKFDPFVDIV